MDVRTSKTTKRKTTTKKKSTAPVPAQEQMAAIERERALFDALDVNQQGFLTRQHILAELEGAGLRHVKELREDRTDEMLTWMGAAQRTMMMHFLTNMTGTPPARAAPSTVFRSSIAMVIGPTPPGTGVRCEAAAAQLAKSTSPTSRYPRFLEASSTALIPTSMTTAPGFSQAPCTYSAIPHAATTMSASRIRAGAPASGRPRRWLQQGGRGGPHDAAAADNERPACPRSRRRSSGPREGSTRSSRYLSLQSVIASPHRCPSKRPVSLVDAD